MKPITLLILWLASLSLTAQPTETWYGILVAGPNELPIRLDMRDGSGSLVSPRQSPAAVPFTDLSVRGDSITFMIAALQLNYAGVVGGDSLFGTFSQGTFHTDLTFYRTPPPGYAATDPAPRVRPQEPTDFPYRRDTVSFPGGSAEVTLAGELTQPEEAPHAVVVLISGSGPQDRNETLGSPINHRPFLILSDYLTRRGYAVLRYDDRGVGESTGDFAAATSADFAEDAAAAVGYLRGRPEFAGLPLGLIGHSEGGMIAPMVAGATPEVDFLVLLAGPGIDIDSVMLEQRRRINGTGGSDEPVVRAAYAYLKYHAAADSASLASGLRDTIYTALAGMPASFRESVTDSTAYAAAYVQSLTAPWMRYFLAFRPGEYLEQVTVPVLALNGALDTQVDADANLAGVEAALDRTGNADVTIESLPGLNHLFQPADSGLPQEYGDIEVTFAPEALDRIGAWLDARFR
ncbi:alpha/beta hydrolase [Lewinella sp. IMCC34183]|uniref:alpha/beta hydrolase n=1 Tax=Lewinella sp. IMCC34183 TaxID=2248762 RepID=UPI000E2514A5|nr:alpha/beta fold hydrolase [Lewinella sp. IMCC34183]